MQIVAIGMSSHSGSNGNWTSGNSIPVLVDPLPYNTWSNWGAAQRDLFFLDLNGNFVEKYNITDWNSNKILTSINTILTLSSP